jgi:hypothetical protein
MKECLWLEDLNSLPIEKVGLLKHGEHLCIGIRSVLVLELDTLFSCFTYITCPHSKH